MTDEEFYEKRNSIKIKWKHIKIDNEFQNYDVSNIGTLRKHDTKKELKLSKKKGMKNHYEFYQLKLNNGNIKNIGIHRIMCIAFKKIPKKYIKQGLSIDDLVVDHKDNIKYHNIISNLQWLTPLENIQKSSNKSINSSKLEKKIVKKICKDLENGYNIYDISCKYNISELIVHNILYKLRYIDISKKYNFPRKQLKKEDVIKICEALSKGLSCEKISKKYGYTTASISHILCGNTYIDISKDYIFPNKKLTEDKVIEICELLMSGLSCKKISKKINIPKSTIEKIKYGQSHTNISSKYIFPSSDYWISDNVIINICEDLVSKKYTMKEISKRNNVSLSRVKDIKYRKSKTDISQKYKW